MDQRPWHRWYDEGVSPSLDFVNQSIVANLFAAARRFPDRPALIFENGRMSYRELEDAVRRFAAALASLGVKRDSRVAIHLPNLPQTVIAYYATLALGAQAVMTNPLYVAREIVHQWNDSGVDVAVTGDWLYEQKIRDIRSQLGVRHYVTTAIADTLRPPLRWLATLKLKHEGMAAAVTPDTNVHDFMTIMRAHAPKTDLRDPDLDSVAVLQYTGGTTGVAKGAMLSHRNLAYNTQQTAAWFPSLIPGGEVLLACLPYFHIFGMTVSLNWGIMLGATIVLMPNPRDVPKMIKLIAKHRVTIYPSLPALFNAIVHHPAAKKADLTSVKGCFSGSAPLPVKVMEDFERITGGRIVEGFGMTETSPVTHVNPINGTRKPGSIGIPVSDTDARIVDIDTGETNSGVNVEGELVVKGPQVMMGYWKRPDETAKMIHDGWLFTGDLARMDEDGYFWIVGRKKDMIVASGYNVYPDEVDRVLMSHPKILEAATIGVPDPARGETVKSFIVLKPGMDMTDEEVTTYCRSQLAAYKVPKILEFRRELPKSAVQKILRRELVREEQAKREAAAKKA